MNKKKISIFFLSVLLVLGLFVPAAEAKAGAGERRYAKVAYVNPVYADSVTEKELKVTAPVYFTDGEIEYHETVEAAGAAVREQLEDRVDVITVGVLYDDFVEDVIYEVFDEALEHTGVPTQGDSIAYTYGGWGGGLNGYSDESSWYITITYNMIYYTNAEQEAELDAAVDDLLEELDVAEADDYTKVCAIYDYLCDNIVYDYDNLGNSEYKLQYTAYAALINKTCVCQGYANLFYRLALELGVDTRIISGNAGGPHAWNIVELEELYYNLDSTWDAERTEYAYFLKSQEGFSDHFRDAKYETEEFHAAYPMSGADYADRSEGGVEDDSTQEPDDLTDNPGDPTEETVNGVAIDENNFPDAVFRQYVSDNFDTDMDGCLSEEETDVFTISVDNMGIQSLKGIEHFKNLGVLICKSNEALTELDVSQNPKLATLWCEWCPIGSLDVSHNPELEYLYCTNCSLTELNVTHNPELKWLFCDYNEISELNLSQNPKLEKLICDSMKLTELDVSNNPNLFFLMCQENELTELDISSLTKLETLWCNCNELTELDVSHNLNLKQLECGENKLSSLDIGMLTQLEELACIINRLTQLSVSNNAKLKILRCGVNPIKELDVSACTELEILQCNQCELTELDISKNLMLNTLSCGNNLLTKLDLSKNVLLESISCNENLLGELDVRNNSQLILLWCYGNQLTKLDVTKNTKLTDLNCNRNQLEELNLSSNKELTVLQCAFNQLAGIDLSNNTKLEQIFSIGNIKMICQPTKLSNVPGFDPAKVSKWYTDVYNPETDRIEVDEYFEETYTYDCGNNHFDDFRFRVHVYEDLDGNGFCDTCGYEGNTEPTPDTPVVPSDPIEAFVTRMYRVILEREPDAGSATWVNGLKDGSFTGVRVADGFVLSDEMLNKDISNEEFVKILYRAFFGREADEGGLKTWKDLLDAGCKKQYVFAGFANSGEFGKLCAEAGIVQGRAAEYLADCQTGLSEQDYKVWCFVERMYTEVLGRTADEAGVRTWVGVLQDGSYTGVRVADGFLMSDEFLAKEMTNEEYVQIMYRAFFGRDADPEGLATWTGALADGWTKKRVFAGFANSGEFTVLCEQAGIVRGTAEEQ